MSGLNLFILAFVVILALAFWNWRNAQESKQELQQSGFNITERFGGAPELVIDTQRQQLALISGAQYERFPLSDLQSAELASDYIGDSETNYRIELQLRDQRQIKVRYHNEWDARKALKRLQALMVQ